MTIAGRRLVENRILFLGMYWAGVIFFLKLFHALVMLIAINSKLSVDVFRCRLAIKGLRIFSSSISSTFFFWTKTLSSGTSHFFEYFLRISLKFIKMRLSSWLFTLIEVTGSLHINFTDWDILHAWFVQLILKFKWLLSAHLTRKRWTTDFFSKIYRLWKSEMNCFWLIYFHDRLCQNRCFFKIHESAFSIHWTWKEGGRRGRPELEFFNWQVKSTHSSVSPRNWRDSMTRHTRLE